MQILGIKSSVYTSFSKHNSNLTDKEKSLIENLVENGFQVKLMTTLSSDNYKITLEPYIKNGLVTLIDWKFPPPCQAEASWHSESDRNV